MSNKISFSHFVYFNKYLKFVFYTNSRNLAIGIGIQNFPEGLAVSLPLRGAGFSSWKSFWYAFHLLIIYNRIMVRSYLYSTFHLICSFLLHALLVLCLPKGDDVTFTLFYYVYMWTTLNATLLRQRFKQRNVTQVQKKTKRHCPQLLNLGNNVAGVWIHFKIQQQVVTTKYCVESLVYHVRGHQFVTLCSMLC